ncbi:hypothetical protein [Azospirillum isscasi]|uniref:Uncharacterized protein n=1 Tax=Azospirillum isscasi TaxID=3053926 RepID=A0ABU0WP84_9PROT|nr:hypothetical protein [Azospirillum isscasi]MDQ2104619.1 hypothetical protein [Azospirillum isscasi]
MRCQQLLNTIQGCINNGTTNGPRATVFAQNANIRGGWEVWLQLEIAHGFLTVAGNWTCERERPYPSTNAGNPYLTYAAGGPAWGVTNNINAAARADFYLHRNAGVADDAYIELKCISPTNANPIQDAWNRFQADIVKQQTLRGGNAGLNCISVLATFGTFQAADVAGANPDLGWFWAGGRTAYVYDVANNQVSTLQNVAQGGAPRLFLVAVSA